MSGRALYSTLLAGVNAFFTLAGIYAWDGPGWLIALSGGATVLCAVHAIVQGRDA